VLRITEIREMTEQGGTISVLKLEGNIQGQWVKELRRVAASSVKLVIADQQVFDHPSRVDGLNKRR
jgi:hypothetical protein